ncbi:hypothetical protein QL093DRAFT_2084233 [Fusarium oxysporum]|nr:hypothetical protein QL093DRAFT_2084233 [Fusarium oxysporum]
MAAAYTKDLLRQIPPSKVEAERRVGEVLSSRNVEYNQSHRIRQSDRTSMWPRSRTGSLLLTPRPMPIMQDNSDTKEFGSGSFVVLPSESRKLNHVGIYGFTGCRDVARQF